MRRKTDHPNPMKRSVLTAFLLAIAAMLLLFTLYMVWVWGGWF